MPLLSKLQLLLMLLEIISVSGPTKNGNVKILDNLKIIYN
jgi:hypothetical protein